MQAARPIRGPHGGWQKQEIDALRQSIEAAEQSGESLRSVFDRMSRQLGRKPNSIRNFYYAQVRAEQGEGGARAMPFPVKAVRLFVCRYQCMNNCRRT